MKEVKAIGNGHFVLVNVKNSITVYYCGKKIGKIFPITSHVAGRREIVGWSSDSQYTKPFNDKIEAAKDLMWRKIRRTIETRLRSDSEYLRSVANFTGIKTEQL